MEDTTALLFRKAIAAIDAGRTAELIQMVSEYPVLTRYRLPNREDGYFKDPYLLYYIAFNPVRTNKPPHNIIETAGELVQAVKREVTAVNYQEQIGFTLRLVASGSSLREQGVQIAMIDLLIDAGALPDYGMEALANGNPEAAQHLIDRGEEPTLAMAVCLEHAGEVDKLVSLASAGEKIAALAAAAFYGKAHAIKQLLQMNIEPNGFPEEGNGFHSHGTPLHHAVSSGDLAAVQLLVEAGAKLDVPDKIYNGTPLEWADYMFSVCDEGVKKNNFFLIAAYLRSFV